MASCYVNGFWLGWVVKQGLLGYLGVMGGVFVAHGGAYLGHKQREKPKNQPHANLLKLGKRRGYPSIPLNLSS